MLLQTIMELQKTVGGLDESVKILSATVTDQSRKIDDCRTDLGAKIDTRFEKLTQEIGTNRSEIAKYAGGVSVARWFIGTLNRHWRTDRRPAVAPPGDHRGPPRCPRGAVSASPLRVIRSPIVVGRAPSPARHPADDSLYSMPPGPCGAATRPGRPAVCQSARCRTGPSWGLFFRSERVSLVLAPVLVARDALGGVHPMGGLLVSVEAAPGVTSLVPAVYNPGWCMLYCHRPLSPLSYASSSASLRLRRLFAPPLRFEWRSGCSPFKPEGAAPAALPTTPTGRS